MPPLKNLRQEMFCQEYVKDHNGMRSYRASGYQSRSENAIAVGAVQILRSIKVKARIMEIEAPAKIAKRRAERAIAEKAIIDRAWVVGRLVENVDRSMQAVPVLDNKGHRTGEYQYEGGVANRGLELIGKDLGMFVEKDSPPGDTYNIVNFYVPHNDREAHVPNGHGRKTKVIGNGHGN